MKIISIGSNCNVRDFIRKNYNMETYPFDWLITNINFLIDVFETSTLDFCSIENLYYDFSHNTIHIMNKNTEWSALSIHDTKGLGLNRQLFIQKIPVINKKYQRRFERLYNVLHSDKEIFLIRQILEEQQSVSQEHDSLEKLNYLLSLLENKFNKNIIICIVNSERPHHKTNFNDLKLNSKHLKKNIKLFNSFSEIKTYIDNHINS